MSIKEKKIKKRSLLMEKLIKDCQLKLTQKQFVTDKGDTILYYNIELLLPSGADLKIKIDNNTAGLIYNGFLK
jgi:hypothetical protein